MRRTPSGIEQAAAIAERGVELLRRAGFDGATPRTPAGRDAGHALAAASSPHVVLFIAAGHRRFAGPKSVGHVTRFVVDHAPGTRVPTTIFALMTPNVATRDRPNVHVRLIAVA